MSLPADPHRGATVPDALRAALDRVRERSWPLGDPSIYFDETESTNDVAVEAAAHGAPEGTLVVAACQTRGRGRQGRDWYSPRAAGIYFSLVFRPAQDETGRAATLLTLAAGVAASEAIEQVAGLNPQIKWPNDLVIESGTAGASSWRKLGGILAEGTITSGVLQHVVVGIGINIRDTAYPPELSDRATSIAREIGHDVDGWAVLAESVACLAERWRQMLGGSADLVLADWRRRSPSAVGAPVVITRDQERVRGVTRGLADDGRLLVDAGGSTFGVIAGEVQWL